MGLCLNFLSVFESKADVVCAVDGGVIHQRVPVFQLELGERIPQRLENSEIALHYYILVGESPGDIVLLGQPGELHIAFDLSILLRRYPEGNRLITPAIMLVPVL